MYSFWKRKLKVLRLSTLLAHYQGPRHNKNHTPDPHKFNDPLSATNIRFAIASSQLMEGVCASSLGLSTALSTYISSEIFDYNMCYGKLKQRMGPIVSIYNLPSSFIGDWMISAPNLLRKVGLCDVSRCASLSERLGSIPSLVGRLGLITLAWMVLRNEYIELSIRKRVAIAINT